MQRPSAILKNVLQRHTCTWGESHKHTHILTNKLSSFSHHSSATECYSMYSHINVKTFFFKTATANSQRVWFCFQPTVERISKKSTIKSRKASKNISPVSPSLLVDITSESCTDGFVWLLCVFIIRSITKGGRLQLQALAAALSIYYCSTCTSAAQVFPLPHHFSCHFHILVSGFMDKIWKSVSDLFISALLVLYKILEP